MKPGGKEFLKYNLPILNIKIKETIIAVLFFRGLILKSRNCIICCIFFYVGLYRSFAQVDPCHKSTEGTDFWFGIMENIGKDSDHYTMITVTARETTTFKFTIGKSETPYNGEYTVNANSSVQVKIPWEQVEAVGSEEIQEKAIHLTSVKPVNVYSLNWQTNTSDAALIYPVESLGKEYFAMSYYPSHRKNDTRSNSQFLVVASEDSTIVKITPSKVTDKLKPKDSTFVVIINRGEVYQVQSDNVPGNDESGQGDLTGSFISSSKPVAFYSGVQSTRIPSGMCCWDHLYEQIPPIQSWGLEYYAVPLKSRQQDRYRIMAARDNTTINISGERSFSLNRGEFKELVFFYNEPKRILSDKPVMVAQFSQSRNVDSDFTGGNGDPFMIILSSSTQSKNNVTFVAFDSNQIERYFVNIIAPTDETENITLEGDRINNYFTSFPEGKYSWAQIPVLPGTYNLRTTDGGRGFIAYVYGYGGIESYGYGVGYNLDIVLDLGKSIDFEGDTLLLCYGSSRTLDAGSFFDNYLWNTGDTTQTLTIREKGKYHVTASTIDGCVLEDSIYLYVSNPEVDLGIEYDQGCEPYSVELDAGEGFNSYLWQNQKGDTLSIAQKYSAQETSEYRLTVFDQFGCAAHATMELIVFPVPDVDITGPNLVCGQQSVRISASLTGTRDSVWNYENSFEWKTNKPAAVRFSEKTHTSVLMEVDEWGEYLILYQLVTIDGCERNDTFNIRFHPQPSSDFILDNDEKCEGYSQKLIYAGNATDSASFYWDLDGCQFLDTLGWQKYNVSVGAFLDDPPHISLYIDDNGCLSDTTIKQIGAKPNFTMNVNPDRGCDQLTANFTGELLTEDNVVYNWEFDDGETATTQNVTKHYNKPGYYGATLTVTNPVSQCRNSFHLDSMVKIFLSPVASISADSDFCYSDTASIFYPNANDSIQCYWEFDGIHQAGNGKDSITVVIDEPVGSVSLVVEENGCLSDTSVISLKRKPHFDIIVSSNEGCQPFTTEVFADAYDEHLEFSWITDSLTYPTGNSNIFVFPDSGHYDVGLIAYSSQTGCSDTLLKTDFIWVHPKPVADYEGDYPVALLENARISFTNHSENADYYLWNFGDGDSITGRDAVHTYLELGEYTTQLIAESIYGCRDTAELMIKILPFSNYFPNAFRPGSPVEENRTFMPVGTGADPLHFNLEIFDRNGQTVFETTSPEFPWDGTTPKGKPAPMGNYVWIARYLDIQGFRHKQKGQVLLIR